MDNPKTISKENHLVYLDSARGIAASMVFVMHFYEHKYYGKPIVSYLSMIFNGRDAVSFFFVLSGFVLSYKYIVLGKSLDILKFFVTRVFRLLPAFVLTVLATVIYFNRHDLSLRNLSAIFLHDQGEFWEEAVLFRGHNIIYGPGWTLSREFVISFFMPFSIVIAQRDRKLVPYLILAFFIIGPAFICLFNIHFMLGLLISCYYATIAGDAFKQTFMYRYRYIILPLAFLLFSIRNIDNLYGLGPQTINYIGGYIGFNLFLYTGFASFIFLIAIVHSKKAQKFLEKKILVFLGKISYGLYLIHYLMVTIIFDHWEQLRALVHFNYPLFVISAVILYSITTIAAATLIHKFIEVPFMTLGKRLSNKMRPSYVIKGKDSIRPTIGT